jgi:conjugal transfer ATP-binding protein TraC
MEKVLASLFVSCPPGTGIQVSLYGSPNILPLLRAQARLLPGPDPAANEGFDERRYPNIFRTLARRRIDHYLKGPGSRSLAPDLPAARLSPGDLDHPAARPRAAGRRR